MGAGRGLKVRGREAPSVQRDDGVVQVGIPDLTACNCPRVGPGEPAGAGHARGCSLWLSHETSQLERILTKVGTRFAPRLCSIYHEIRVL